MLTATALSVLLTVSAGAAEPSSRTLWIFQPLYPGQDYVVARGEEALTRLMPPEARQGDIVGRKELAAYLGTRKPDLDCLSGDVACQDPVDSFVSNLGFDRLVLLKGGQEDNSYRFKVTSYQPTSGEVAYAEGTGTSLDRALLAAMVKVVPLAAALEVVTTPPGATVMIDSEKVGVTPYTGQILPGERVVKIDLASHMPFEKKVDVTVRGNIKITETLEKVPAQLVVTATPPTTTISVDGLAFATVKAENGAVKADKAIQPGKHRVQLTAEGYLPLEETVDIAPGATVSVDKKLEPTTWTSIKNEMIEQQNDIYSRADYFQISFENARLFGNQLSGTSNATNLSAKELKTDTAMVGGSLEYGHNGRYFGVMIVGLAYYQTRSEWTYRVGDAPNAEDHFGTARSLVLRGLQPFARVALWRFQLSAQGGLEGRVLQLFSNRDTPQTATSGFFSLDPQLAIYLKLRFYVLSGLFAEGGWRMQYNPFADVTAPFWGLHGGVGFAF